MRLIRILFAISFVTIGILVGSLNGQRITLDLGIATVPASLGVLVLAALSAGVIVGGLMVALSTVLPLRRGLKLARARTTSPHPPPHDGA